MNPIIALSDKMKLLKNGIDVSIILDKKYENNSYFYNNIYKEFNKLSFAMKFRKNLFLEMRDTEAIV